MSLCLSVPLRTNNYRSIHVVSFCRFSSLVSTSFLLLSWFRLLQRRSRHTFLLLLQAAQRVGVALFPLPLLPPPLSVFLADALLLLQAADALLLGRGHQLPQLNGLDVVQGRLAGLVQHDGVEDDVEQRDAWDLFESISYCTVLHRNGQQILLYAK